MTTASHTKIAGCMATIRVMAVLLVGFAAVSALLAGVSFASLGSLDPGQTVEAEPGLELGLRSWTLALGLFAGAQAVLYCILAFLGFRGAADACKVGSFGALTIIVFLVLIISQFLFSAFGLGGELGATGWITNAASFVLFISALSAYYVKGYLRGQGRQ